MLRLETLATLELLADTDRTRPVTLRPRPVQHPVTSVTSVRLHFFASGAVENRHFIFQKNDEPKPLSTAQTSPPSQMC
jgi:hypothetical protein